MSRIRSSWLAMIAAAVLWAATLPTAATAGVIGFLGNFDVINDTGQTCYGFEIELEGLHSSDVTDVFGGPGRGFPTGRGFDPNEAVERYGAPTISEYATGVRVTYSAIWDPNSNSWDYSTPSGNTVTPGDNCWTGGGIGYDANTSCDHFGVGTRINPTKTTYSWLQDLSPGSGVLTASATGVAHLPAPVWQVIPDPVFPQAPPQVVAQIEAPEVEAYEFGEALWVKVFSIEYEDPTELEDLVGDNEHIQQAIAEIEIEWQLLQKDSGDPNSGQLESGYGIPVGPDAASIVRRYEFYAFSGVYDEETHEAQPVNGDSHPTDDEIGTYLGSQNAAVNLVPEPSAGVLVLAALVGVGVLRRLRG